MNINHESKDWTPISCYHFHEFSLVIITDAKRILPYVESILLLKGGI